MVWGVMVGGTGYRISMGVGMFGVAMGVWACGVSTEIVFRVAM